MGKPRKGRSRTPEIRQLNAARDLGFSLPMKHITGTTGKICRPKKCPYGSLMLDLIMGAWLRKRMSLGLRNAHPVFGGKGPHICS